MTNENKTKTTLKYLVFSNKYYWDIKLKKKLELEHM